MIFASLITYFGKAASCSGGSFLGFPTWYHYLPGQTDPNTHTCSPQLTGLGDIWLIVAAIIEIMLRVAAIVAVIFIIYGAVSYITSQGNSETTSRARGTITDALVGLAIAVMASAIVAYIAGHIA